jgi:hypothetical protein
MDEAALVALALVVFGWAIISERFAARNSRGRWSSGRRVPPRQLELAMLRHRRGRRATDADGRRWPNHGPVVVRPRVTYTLLTVYASPAVTSSPPVDPDAGQHPGVLQRCPSPSDPPEHDDRQHAESNGKSIAGVPFHERSLRRDVRLVFIPGG